MHTRSFAFITPPDAPRWQRWLVFSAMARIVFFTAMLLGIGFAIHGALAILRWAPKTATPLQLSLVTLSLQLLPAWLPIWCW